MIGPIRRSRRWLTTLATGLGAAMLLVFPISPAGAADPPSPAVEQMLDRTGSFVVKFLDDFSNMKCTELVSQTKLGKGGKVEYAENSTYDYLVMTQSPNGDLTLVESRLAGKQPNHKRNLPLLVTDGFSTLLLIFHPSYQMSFEFVPMGNETVDGKLYAKVHFRHVRGTRSTAALLLRGREYPLESRGTPGSIPRPAPSRKSAPGSKRVWKMWDYGDSSVTLSMGRFPCPEFMSRFGCQLPPPSKWKRPANTGATFITSRRTSGFRPVSRAGLQVASEHPGLRLHFPCD